MNNYGEAPEIEIKKDLAAFWAIITNKQASDRC
jgi:hypothetical protein